MEEKTRLKLIKQREAIKRMKQANRADLKKRQQATFNINITPRKYQGMYFLGNFPNKNCYRNEELRDHRLSRLPSSLFTNKRVIDVGAGDGSLAIQIAMRFFPAQIIALDMDGKLLGRAKAKADKIVESNAIYTSQEQALLKKIQELPLYFQDLFCKNKQKYSLKPDHLIQVIPQGETFINKFPDNFSVYNQNFLNIQSKQQYDTILIMGTSKWVHLALGDEGLIKLFEKAYDLLANQGFLVVQYPLYRSYHKKKNICKLYSKNLREHIKIDPITFPSILCHMGFVLVEQLVSIPQVTLKHPIAIFSKIQTLGAAQNKADI